MTQTTSLTMATTLSLFCALPLLAQTGEEKPPKERPEASRQAVWAESQQALLEGIELNAEQRSEIEAIDTKYADQIDGQQQRRAQLREDLDSAQEAGKVSEAKRIRGQLREMRRAPGRAAHVNAIRQVLNAGQRVSFDANRKAFRERARQQRQRARQERPPRPAPSAIEGSAEGEGAGPS